MVRLSFVFLLMLTINVAYAQKSSNAYSHLADSLYQSKNYAAAATYYERALKNTDASAQNMLKLARSYRRMNNLKDAEAWYSKAKANDASFTQEDKYAYEQTLISQGKKDAAIGFLTEWIATEPATSLPKKLLDDVIHNEKFYLDSGAYEITSLTLNTSAAEFAPAFYKDGIVFTSARSEGASRKKYHWDDSYFLNLYYSKSLSQSSFDKPILLNKSPSTKSHAGPAAFYANGSKMIVNQNKPAEDSHDGKAAVRHLGLYDAVRSPDNKTWILKAMPFDLPNYSFAHPAISEDGNTLYFSSDMPGGYGGSDLYRVQRAVDNTWSQPFNLGPTINTAENEVFPFFIDKTLYFSSNGRGGLGGLDIFKSNITGNGFAPPANLGAPINSSSDDFSYITRDGKVGYFASARTGNDDLFTFTYRTEIPLLAHLYDGKSKEPLAGATIELMTASGHDTTLVSDQNGDVHFSLPKEDAFVMIATKDGKSGMLSSIVKPTEDAAHYTHQIPAFGDPEKVACVGYIKDDEGLSKSATQITITDLTTGHVLENQEGNSMVSFMGEKAHDYDVLIANERGDTTHQIIHVKANDTGTKTWYMVLKTSQRELIMAARIFNAIDNTPLPYADVKIITFLEDDIVLKADSAGRVEFKLMEGTAYMVIGSAGDVSGMHSGVAEKGTDKNSITHPVSVQGLEDKALPVMIVVLNEDGKILTDANAYVIDKATGESQLVEIKKGVVSFVGERGKQYSIKVNHEGYRSEQEELNIRMDAQPADKLSIVLHQNQPLTLNMAARAFKASDNTSMEGADVSIISMADDDVKRTANTEGEVTFTMPEGTAYIVFASKDGYSGMHSGVAERGTDRTSIVHPVPMVLAHDDQVATIIQLADEEGNKIEDAKVIVTDKASGEKVDAFLSDGGLVTFSGKKGSDYSIEAIQNNKPSLLKDLSIPTGSALVSKMIFTIPQPVPVEQIITIRAHVVREDDQTDLSFANITLISLLEADEKHTADSLGNIDFVLPNGTAFVIIADKDGYSGMYPSVAEPAADKSKMIHLISTVKLKENEVPVVLRIEDETGQPLEEGSVSVRDKTTGDTISAKLQKGTVNFIGERDREYSVIINGNENAHLATALVKPSGNGLVKKLFVPVVPAVTVMKTPSAETNMTDPQHDSVDPTSDVVIILNEDEASHVFIVSQVVVKEIIEEQHKLYLKGDGHKTFLRDGTLQAISRDTAFFQRHLSLQPGNMVSINNIYFDFNTTMLDDKDKQAIQNVASLLEKYPHLHVYVNAHADDRGSESYNFSLSKRRAKAVAQFVEKSGINESRITRNSFGETQPATTCLSCTEDQHMLNRRAEFTFSMSKSTSSTGNGQSNYETLLDQYGDRTIPSVEFKVTIGVFKRQHNLQFLELQDIGSVESKTANGITYYYLAPFNSLRSAEHARKQVIDRGIKDAAIRIEYNGKAITLAQFIQLANP